MPNPENVIKHRSIGKPFTSESAREARQIRTAKEKANASILTEFKKLVNEYQTDKHGTQMLGAEILAKSIFQGCINGNSKAMELALQIMGEMPSQRVDVSINDNDRLKEVEKVLFDET